MKPFPATKFTGVLVIALAAASCAPPSPRVYRPEVSNRIERISHQPPTTPLPDPGAVVWEIH